MLLQQCRFVCWRSASVVASIGHAPWQGPQLSRQLHSATPLEAIISNPPEYRVVRAVPLADELEDVSKFLSCKLEEQWDTGDLERKDVEPKVDLTLPCYEFEGLPEFDTAPDIVKKVLSLQYSDYGEQRKRFQWELIKRVQRYEDDVDSIEARIARITGAIRFVTPYVMRKRAAHKHDFRTIQVLIAYNRQRRRLLTHLRNTHYEKFAWVLEQLRLTYTPYVFVRRYRGVEIYKALRRKEALLILKKKFEDYHAVLKERQVEFLERKKRLLEHMDDEERTLKAELEQLKSPEEEEELVDTSVAWMAANDYVIKWQKGIHPPPFIPDY